MTDLSATIVPKSDQLNFDDLLGGRTLTIKVTKVSLAAGDQPVTIHYEGDNGHPYKPGKSMRRVLVAIWGRDGNAYIGRSMTLYGDPEVQFGGAKVGGIRISHMSHIDQPVTMALTATRASRKPFTVKPLKVDDSAPAGEPSGWRTALLTRMKDAGRSPEHFVEKFGALKTFPYSQLPEAEQWIAASNSSDLSADQGTCSECGGPLTEDLRCHNQACPLGEPPD